jgi:hypothetical protein
VDIRREHRRRYCRIAGDEGVCGRHNSARRKPREREYNTSHLNVFGWREERMENEDELRIPSRNSLKSENSRAAEKVGLWEGSQHGMSTRPIRAERLKKCESSQRSVWEVELMNPRTYKK